MGNTLVMPVFVRGLSVGCAYRLHPRLCSCHRAAVRIRVYQNVRLCPCGHRPAISYSLYLTQHAHVPTDCMEYGGYHC